MKKHRESIHLEGVKHSTPIPLASRVGNMVFSSGIMGADPRTGTWPIGPAEQVRLAFVNMAAVMEKAGGSVADIGRVTVLVDNDSVRPFVDPQWLKWFPDEGDRPARHMVCTPLRRGLLVQLEFIAVLP